MELHHRLLLSLFIITIGLFIATYVEWTKFQNNPLPEDDTSIQTWEYLKWATVGFVILTILSGGYSLSRNPKVYKPKFTKKDLDIWPYGLYT